MNRTSSETLSPPRIRVARFALAACVVIAFATFSVWPSRYGQFLSGDDERLILNHYLVNHPSVANARTLITHVTDDLYQPLPMISFQIDYARAEHDSAGRFAVDSAPFHQTNIWLHAINSVLVLLLVRRLAGCMRIALLTALLFASHPFAVEPVAWINGRMILLAATFSLVTMWAMVVPRRGGAEGAGLAAYLLSIACKVLPTVPIAAAWMDWKVNGRWSRRRMAAYGGMVMLAVIGGLLAVRSVGRVVSGDPMSAADGESVPVRVLLAFSYYLENYFWPARLAAWSPPALGITLLSSRCVIALAECAAFIAALFIARRWERSVLLGLGVFAILLISFLAAGTTRRFLAADRYMYLPILGLHLAFAVCVIRGLDRLRRAIGEKSARLVVGGPVIGILVACVWWSEKLSETWQDSVRRDRRIVEVYPDEPDARAQLAKAEIFCGDPDGAIRVIVEARKRWPEQVRLAAAAGDAYRAKHDWVSAERELRIAAERLPGHLRTQYEYALTLEALERPALEQYERILKIDPNYLPAILAIARLHQAAGRPDEAIAYCERALAINPVSVESLRRLAGLRMGRGEDETALKLLEQAADVDPTDLTAMVWLHVLLAEAGRTREIAQEWQLAMVAGLATSEARSWLAWASFQMGHRAEGEELARQVLEPPDAVYFVEWARAVEALRAGNKDVLEAMDKGGLFARGFESLKAERRRAIIAAIGHLEEERRNSSAAFYLVSRAFLIDGSVDAARKVAQRNISSNKPDYWTAATRRLLEELAASRPANEEKR